MLLGFITHSADYYIIARLFRAEPVSEALVAITSAVHRFRMPTFFLLSGFFAALLVARYGLKGAAASRIRRILVPFLIALATILPLTLYLYFCMVATVTGNRAAFIKDAAQGMRILSQMTAWHVPTFSVMHLWFLHFLIVLYLLVPLWESLMQLAGRQRWATRVEQAAARPQMILLLSVPTALALWPHPGAIVPIDDRSLVPDLAGLGYYAIFFFAGYSLYRCRGILDTFRAHVPAYGTLAVLLFLCLYVPGWVGAGGSFAGRTATVAAAALCTWMSIYCVCGLYLNTFDRLSSRVRYLDEASYWIYLIQVPLIFLIGILLTPLQAADVVKFGILALLTLLASLASYALVRDTWVIRLLSSRSQRLPRPGSASAGECQAAGEFANGIVVGTAEPGGGSARGAPRM